MMYADDGSWNVTVLVDPDDTGAPVGVYAADGSVNVVQAPTPVTAPVGAYHPCGAMYVTVDDAATVRYAPDGSLNVSETSGDGQRVTVVAGAFA